MSERTSDPEIVDAVRLAAQGAFGFFERDLYDTPPAEVWRELARADLLSLVLPESSGGSGLGSSLHALCALFEAAGRTLGHRPLWSALALGMMPLVDHFEGTDGVDLSSHAAGDSMTVGAFTEGNAADWDIIGTRLVDAGGRSLHGLKTFVWDLEAADKVLVSARTEDDAVVIVHVPTSRPGVTVRHRMSTDLRWVSDLILDDVEVLPQECVELRGGKDDLDIIMLRAELLLASTLVGAASTALDLTVAHVGERQQFGRPLGAFQAVSQRAAEAWILLEVATSAIAHAATLGTPAGVPHEAAVVWALRAGAFAVDAAHHLHGGIGVGLDYPLWRYTRTCRHLELTLGSEAKHLGRIQDAFAAEVTPPR